MLIISADFDWENSKSALANSMIIVRYRIYSTFNLFGALTSTFFAQTAHHPYGGNAQGARFKIKPSKLS